MCGKRAAAAGEGGKGRGLGPAPISSRGPRYSGLMGLQRSEQHRRVAAVVSVALVIYWANFLSYPPPHPENVSLFGLRGGGRRRRARRPRGSRETPSRICAWCVQIVCIHKCVCVRVPQPWILVLVCVCARYRGLFIKGCLAAGM